MTINNINNIYMNFIFIIIGILLLLLVILYLITLNRVFLTQNNYFYESFNNSPPKIAIITSIYGNYDNLKIQNINDKNMVDWYCFTDNNNLKSDLWNIILTPYHIQNNKKDYSNFKNNYSNIKDKKTYNMMCAKYYKAKTHEINILSDYDYYIWIDGSILLRPNFISNIIDIINTNSQPKLICFKHSVRDNIKDELEVSLKLEKYKNQDLKNQYNQYINNGYPDSIGLFENTIMIKKNDAKINKLFDEWWIQNLKYSYQDQISLPYVMWKLNIIPDYIINENVFNNQTYSYVDYNLLSNH